MCAGTVLVTRKLAEGKLSFQALAVYSFILWCIYDANEIPQLSREAFWNLIGTANSRAAEVNSLNSDKLPRRFLMNGLGTRLAFCSLRMRSTTFMT